MKSWLDFLLEPADISTEPGQRVEPDYKIRYNKKGVKDLVIDGQRNTYDEIQSHRDSVDLALIFKRYLAGDYSVLDRKPGQYLNISDLPETLGEWHNLMARSRDLFYQLDPDVRDKYNHSVEQFVSAVDEELKPETKGVETNE